MMTNNSAVISIGASDLEIPPGHMILPITFSSINDAFESLPSEIQTIGHSVSDEILNEILMRIENSEIKRLVPVGEMHHFGPIWDGMHFWRGLFMEGMDDR